MTKKILKSIIAVAIAAVVVTIIFITGFLNHYFSKRVKDELKNETAIIASAIELNGEKYFESAVFLNMRVTWIDTDGTVLFDSEADASELDNHGNREEVIEAYEKKYGSSYRYSETMMQKTIYYAQRLSDGKVIRVSSAHLSIWAQLIQMMQTFFLIFLAVIIVAAMLATKLSRKIVKPINEIDLNNPDIDESYSELAPLLRKIKTQNKKINRQIDQLRQSREQFSLITENMSEGLIIADRNTIILSYNSSALNLLGAKVPEERQSIYTLNRSESFRDCIQCAIRGNHSECFLETDTGDYQIIANPSYSSEVLNGIVVFILDVTEKQQLEAMRREFTSNVSHELKTPLTTIYGISDMLVNGIVRQEDVVKFGGDIRSEAGRLIILINDIIALSRLDENSVAKEETDIDLYDNTADVFERLSSYADERNITLNLNGSSIIYHGNATIVDEIIYNLCDNAIKYNKDGGSVSVTIDRNENNARIVVEDTGIGIAPQNTERIFERFYRVDKSHSRKIKGTGLGLSIVKHGVRYNNGTIRTESILGKGTKFTVELPLNREKS